MLSYSRLKPYCRTTAVSDTTYSLGLSSTSCLHDLFIKIEGMSPSQYKHGGQGLTLEYGYFKSLFSLCIISSTFKGVCYHAFCQEEREGFESLTHKLPQAILVAKVSNAQNQVMDFFNNRVRFETLPKEPIRLHFKGTPFQLKVWINTLSPGYSKIRRFWELSLGRYP